MFTSTVRSAWAVLVWIVLILLPIQFYLAGFGAFGFHEATSTARDDAWGPHALLGTIIGLAILLLLIAALTARLPRRLLIMSGVLFVLMVVQMILPGFGDSSSTRFIAALHPLNALIITGLTIGLAVRSRPYVPIKRFQTLSDDIGAQVQQST